MYRTVFHVVKICQTVYHLIYLTEPRVHTQCGERSFQKVGPKFNGMSCHLKLRIVRHWTL